MPATEKPYPADKRTIGRVRLKVTVPLIDAKAMWQSDYQTLLSRITFAVNTALKKKGKKRQRDYLWPSHHNRGENTRTLSGASSVNYEANHERTFLLFRAMARNKVISALVWIVCLMSVWVSHLDSKALFPMLSVSRNVPRAPSSSVLHLSPFWVFMASWSPCKRG